MHKVDLAFRFVNYSTGSCGYECDFMHLSRHCITLVVLLVVKRISTGSRASEGAMS